MRHLLVLLCSLSLLGLAGHAAAKGKRRPKAAPSGPAWHTVAHPTAGGTTVVGSYAGGCINGAVAVPEEGVGFETIRRWRNRFYAHPGLVSYLKDLGVRALGTGLPPLLIGDTSQPRGGRMKSGHRSHQIGLDADIWFSHPPKDRRGSDKAFKSLVNRKTETIDRSVFSSAHVELLRQAAAAPEVARVFVNWAIKQELCRSVAGDREWLRKIRPWYGHDSHFHVRLHCPADSPDCRAQRTLPEGDGCGIESWFSRKEKRSRRRAARAKRPVKGVSRGRRAVSPDVIAREKMLCAEILAAADVAPAAIARENTAGPEGSGKIGAPPR